MFTSHFTTYRSYLLRLWRQSPEGPWCASLENVRTRQINYFARTEELWNFIQAEMAADDHIQGDSLPERESVTVSGPGSRTENE